MDKRFATAFFAASAPRILGRTLQPFSLWHAAVLEQIDSPFAGGRRPRTFQELYLAVEVCRLRPNGDSLEVPRPAANLWQRLQLWARLWYWGRVEGRGTRDEGRGVGCLRASRGDGEMMTRRWHGEWVKFLAYLAEGNSSPQYWGTSDGVAIKCPWALYLVARLIAHGVPREEAWRYSPAKAKWYHSGLHEAAGVDPGLVSDAERAALKEAGYGE